MANTNPPEKSIEIKVAVRVRPFPVPDAIFPFDSQTDTSDSVRAIPLSDVDAATLKAMADDWRDMLFVKAGMKTGAKPKTRKPRTARTISELLKATPDREGPRDDESDNGTPERIDGGPILREGPKTTDAFAERATQLKA